MPAAPSRPGCQVAGPLGQDHELFLGVPVGRVRCLTRLESDRQDHQVRRPVGVPAEVPAPLAPLPPGRDSVLRADHARSEGLFGQGLGRHWGRDEPGGGKTHPEKAADATMRGMDCFIGTSSIANVRPNLFID